MLWITCKKKHDNLVSNDYFQKLDNSTKNVNQNERWSYICSDAFQVNTELGLSEPLTSEQRISFIFRFF